MKKKYRIIFIFLIAIAQNPCTAESTPDKTDILSEARKMEDAGNIIEALPVYKSWLKEHAGEKNAPDVLRHIIEIDDNCSALLLFLSELDEQTDNTIMKTEIAQAIAYSRELLGSLSKAGKYYTRIFNADKTDSRYVSLLSAAQILYQQGMFEQSKEALQIIIKHARDNEVLAKAHILLASMYVNEEKWSDAKAIFVSLFKNHKKAVIYPVILSGYCEYMVLQGNQEEGKKVLDVLEKYFPSSPEYKLAKQLVTEKEEGRIIYYPSPLFFIDKNEGGASEESAPVKEESIEENTQDKISYIQTGSFIDRENAEYMLAELIKMNFRAIISEKKVEDRIYYRVFVSVESIKPDDINSFMLKLKEAGFEGFIAVP